MLTKDDLDVLKAPFPPQEIEFLRGYAYVREYAVNNRLSEVDPSWQMAITAWEYRSEMHVVVMGSMTLKDVVRYGVGEQQNDPFKDGKPRALDCAKGAATDLLKRLARLFFVGAYLTELPDSIKTIEQYETWYRGVMGLPQQPRQNRATSPASASNGNGQASHSQPSQNSPSSAPKNGNGMDKDTARQKAIKMLMAAGVDPNAAIKIEPPPNPPTSSNNLDWATRMIERAKAAS